LCWHGLKIGAPRLGLGWLGARILKPTVLFDATGLGLGCVAKAAVAKETKERLPKKGAFLPAQLRCEGPLSDLSDLEPP
jgi:hypothetical protein